MNAIPAAPLTATKSAAPDQVILTLRVAGQACGLPVSAVRDVLAAQSVTRIPLAPPDVAGSLNLRGRIVTALDLRRRLGLPPRQVASESLSVVVDHNGDLYALIVDEVGEIVTLDDAAIETTPPSMAAGWGRISTAVLRLPGELLLILSVDRLLAVEAV